MSPKIVAICPTPGVDNYVSQFVVNQQFQRSLCYSGNINIIITNENLDQCQFRSNCSPTPPLTHQ